MRAGSKSRNDKDVASKLVIHRGVGMPRQFRTKLRYVTRNTLTVDATPASVFYGCNTPNQPSRTFSTTSRPLYWAELSTIYERCYTVGSVITLAAVNTTVPDGIMVVLSNDSNLLVDPEINDLAERTGARKGLMGHYTGGRVTFNASHRFTPEQYIGVQPNALDNTVALGVDPIDPYFWSLTASSFGGGEGNLNYEITIEYDVVFHELKSPIA